MKFLKQKLFGFFDWSLALGMTIGLNESFKAFDECVVKKHPERAISHLLKNAKKISYDIMNIFATMIGYTIEELLDESSISIDKMRQIRKPIFFISSLDDPFFGPAVIPIDHNCD